LIAFLGPYAKEPPPPAFSFVRTFLQALGELGYIDGETATIELRFADGDEARLPRLAAELVQLKPDIIVAMLNGAIAAAKQAAPTTPIVMAWGGDPIAMKFAASLARPGGQITGVVWDEDYDVMSKRVHLLKELRPAIKRVAVVYGGVPGAEPTFADMRRRVPSLGVQLTFIEVPTVNGIDAALAAMEKSRPDAILAIHGAPLWEARVRLADFVNRRRLPMIATVATALVEDAGALMSYAPDVVALMTRPAAYVDRILKGAKPADLPIEQPTKYEFVINMKSAKALGLTIPPSLLLRANRVIE
jgi:putative ABC transport system substrate-binding protein